MPEFDLELSTLRNRADTLMVEPLRPLRLVLAEISFMATKVVQWVRQPKGGGYALCKYDLVTERPVGYLVKAETEKPGLTLGCLVHELTHVAVNEAYGLDFVNYANPDIITRLPQRRYDLSGYADDKSLLSRQLVARLPGQDQVRQKRFDDLIAKATNPYGTAALSVNKRRDQLINQFEYGRHLIRIHLEYDTVINQTLFWLYEWASEDVERTRRDRVARHNLLDSSLFATLSSAVAESYRLRQEGREVWFNAPDLPQTTPGG